MSNASYEVINNVLFVFGSLDRSSDADFQKALEGYIKTVAAGHQVVDMSNVRWLAPSSAKVLIQVGQEIQTKEVKLRVLASRHVMQTLNLLGAKTWLTIESCSVPNAKPGSQPEQEVKADTDSKVVAVEEPAETPVPGAGSGVFTAVKADVSAVPPATDATAAAAVPSGGGTLAAPLDNLSVGAHLLRALFLNRRYSFHFLGGEQVAGVVRGRIGGSWIMLDTHGTRTMVNLDLVQYTEIL